MAEAENRVPEVLESTPRLGPEDRFTFHCDPSIDCFGHCCQDVSILLTPYDVLRMKKALAISSSEFMEQYTSTAYSAEKRVPVVFLKMNDGDKKCPFVSEKGCGVYGNRPWACRMYPLGMAERGTSQAAAERFYFIVKEELCHGHGGGGECAVREFIDGQGVEPYDVMQSSFRRLLALASEGKDALTEQQCAMYYMALYDLDRFRQFVFETRFLSMFDLDESRVASMRNDDEELLELAVEWLAFSLFQQKTMRMNKSAAQQRRAPGPAACESEASPA
jgi:Fe-S-cluster containining protein